MKTISYQITDEHGLHARPASQLSQEAKRFESNIVVRKGEKEVNARQLLALMGLGIRQGEEIAIVIQGADEERAEKEIGEFLTKNL